MTRFEANGVKRQQNAGSKYEADRSFEISCRICCEHGCFINCDHCPIAAAHELTCDVFKALEADKVSGSVRVVMIGF